MLVEREPFPLIGHSINITLAIDIYVCISYKVTTPPMIFSQVIFTAVSHSMTLPPLPLDQNRTQKAIASDQATPLHHYLHINKQSNVFEETSEKLMTKRACYH